MATTSTLPGTVQPAAPGLKGFDIYAPLTADQVQQFVQGGYAFCLRYLSLDKEQSTNDLSFNEAQLILNGGLALSVVQQAPDSGWIPTQELGTTNGTNAVNNAIAVGLPEGMNLWLDLEGVGNASQVIAYCNAWYDAVLAGGFVPGIYVGAGCGLQGDQLYYDLNFQHFWQSGSNVPAVAVRGYQMIQGPTITAYGIQVDVDQTGTDTEGGTVLWLKV